jgi:N-acetylglucosaminyl-diphospho-decaprenol L-rhamnosyltransferase
MRASAARKVATETVLEPATARSGPSVSVVMVVYRTGEALGESLARVLACAEVSELIVVDNGSTADEAAQLAAIQVADPRVRLISGHGNVGFARGANLGARAATGEVLVFVNPDAFLEAGCVAALTAALIGRREPALAGGRILNPDRSEQRGGRRGEITPLSALLSMSGLARRPALARHEVHWEGQVLPPEPAATPTVSGACFAMRRAAFLEMGGFDEGYFLHVEDIDLCWRVRRAGGEVVFAPAAEAVHVGGTSRTSPLKVEFHKGVGLARFFRKRAVGPLAALAAWALTPMVIALALARPLARGR